MVASPHPAPASCPLVTARDRMLLAEFDYDLRPAPTFPLINTRRTGGAVVLGTRSPQDFAAGHVSGSVNVPADGRFAEQAGMVVGPGAEVVVVAPQDREEEIITRLARIGFDTVGGYLREPERAFPDLADDMRQASRVTVDELRRLLDGDEPPLVLDVRNSAERAEDFVDGSLHLPLAELARRVDEIPAGPSSSTARAPTARPSPPPCSATEAEPTSPTCSAATAPGSPGPRRPTPDLAAGAVGVGHRSRTPADRLLPGAAPGYPGRRSAPCLGVPGPHNGDKERVLSPPPKSAKRR